MPFTGSKGGSSRGGGSFAGLAGVVEALPGVLVYIVHFYFVSHTYKQMMYLSIICIYATVFLYVK